MIQQAIWDPEHGITGLEANPNNDLGAPEIPGIRAVWADQRRRLKESAQLLEFSERLSREWAIETGIIENLYEIEGGVTQTLIERGLKSELLSHGSTNRPREYVIQLLRDQRDALDGVFDFVKNGRSLSTSYIKELHAALLRSQSTTEGLDPHGRHIETDLTEGAWKRQANFTLRDGVTYTYCPPEQVGSEMDRLIAMYADHIANRVPSEVQAAWLHHRFTQIHPFQDGNGRIARALASLVLLKDGLFPLVVTRNDKSAYFSALDAADKHDLKPLIALFTKLQMAQFRKATAISEDILVEQNVQAALDGLSREADRIATERREELRGVFGHARAMEDDLDQRLNAIAPSIETALGRVSNNAFAPVSRSGPETNHYYRFQIIENARKHFGYFADTSEYRSWVALNLKWSQRCKLVFAIHGIGRPFNGSLICAPFLEFKDEDEDGQPRAAPPMPVAKEGFVFFYNEDQSKLLLRFGPWCEEVLVRALHELTQNL